MSLTLEPPPSAAQLRAAFDAAAPHTIGIEDEVMLLDPLTYGLVPRAQEVIALLGEDERFKLELPASQLEIVTPPCATVADAAQALFEARTHLATRTGGLVAPAAAGVHPTSPGEGELNEIDRYLHTIRAHGRIARRQLVCALQVHVTAGGADRTLSVYNAARSYLPLLGALAANSPFYEGLDTGLESVRPKLCELLPRQGIPPAIASWDEFAETLRWGWERHVFPPGAWWWELRPHRLHGTLEFRVPDGQSAVADAAAVAAIIQALVAWLGERHDAGQAPPRVPTWQIAESRWSGCRHGVAGTIADPETGRPRRTREILHELLGELEPLGGRLGASNELAHARELIERNGAIRQREVAASEGIAAVPGWLATRFLEPPSG